MTGAAAAVLAQASRRSRELWAEAAMALARGEHGRAAALRDGHAATRRRALEESDAPWPAGGGAARRLGLDTQEDG